MNKARLLLPFLHGVDIPAIEQAVCLAKSMDAVLIPLVLLPLPAHRRSRVVRLDYLQQSNDFLEVVRLKAAAFDVPIERLEVMTEDVVRSISILAGEMDCDGIVLCMSRKDGVLLPGAIIANLLLEATCKFYVIRLQPQGHKTSGQGFRQRLAALFARKSEKPATLRTEQEVFPEELNLSVEA